MVAFPMAARNWAPPYLMVLVLLLCSLTSVLAAPISNVTDTHTHQLEPRPISNVTDTHTHQLEPRGGKRDTTFTIVNATPYLWQRIACREDYVFPWCNNDGWPEFLEPGQNYQLATGTWGVRKSSGDVTYRILGTSEPMSFKIERAKGPKRNAYVHFLEEFHTRGAPKGSKHHMGLHKYPGGANFIISGTEGHFFSINSPDGWMQALYNDIKFLPLKTLVMPRSHHAGLGIKHRKYYRFGNRGNSVTQDKDLNFQLGIGGVRVIDVRPLSDGKQTYESHGTLVDAGLIENFMGVRGQSIPDMVKMVNEWQDKHPGELIIWDIHPTDAFSEHSNIGTPVVERMKEQHRALLYQELLGLKYRLNVPDTGDLTEKPFGSFVEPGKSGVLIRFDTSWLEKETPFPGGKEGFVTGMNFPYNHRWSDMGHSKKMTADQIEYLRRQKPHRTDPLFVSDWLLTQKGIKRLGNDGSIMEQGRPCYSTLYHDLWNATTDEMYPNWISMDGIHSSELKDIAVAMNLCLGARKCGPLGGKVDFDGWTKK